MAEEEVRAFDHRPAAQTAANDLVEELAGLQPQQGEIGGVDQDGIDAQPAEQLDPAIHRHQRLGRGIGPQNTHRRRVEREHHGRPRRAAGHRREPLDQPRMTQVDAVEIADRHGAARSASGKSLKLWRICGKGRQWSVVSSCKRTSCRHSRLSLRESGATFAERKATLVVLQRLSCPKACGSRRGAGRRPRTLRRRWQPAISRRSTSMGLLGPFAAAPAGGLQARCASALN